MSAKQRETGALVDGRGFRVVLVTVPDELTAERLALGLVESRLAACVNRVPGIRSTYSWKGAVESDDEVLLLVKTTVAQLEDLAQWLDREHPYDTPEFIALGPSEVGRAYASWWTEFLSRPGADGAESST